MSLKETQQLTTAYLEASWATHKKEFGRLTPLLERAYVSMLSKITDPEKPSLLRTRMKYSSARVLLGSLGEILTSVAFPQMLTISWLRNRFGELVFLNKGNGCRIPDGILTTNHDPLNWEAIVETKVINPKTAQCIADQYNKRPRETRTHLTNDGLLIPGHIVGADRFASTHVELSSYRFSFSPEGARSWYFKAAELTWANHNPNPLYMLVVPSDSAKVLTQNCDLAEIGVDEVCPLPYTYREIAGLAYRWLHDSNHDAYRKNRELEKIKGPLWPPVNPDHL